MSKKADNSGQSGKASAKQKGKSEVLRMVDFFFDSLYDIVTWVAIASCIGFGIYFLSQHNWRGLMWSFALLLCSVVVMIAIRADQHFFRAQVADVAQPNIVFGDSKLRGPLVAGQTPWVDIALINTSDVPAEARFSNITWDFIPAPFDNQLEYAYDNTLHEISIAAREIHVIHFNATYSLTKEMIDGLNSEKAFLYIYGKGEYWGEKTSDAKYPLPFCLFYHKDTPGLLARCAKSVKIAEERPGNVTFPKEQRIQAQPTSDKDRPFVFFKYAALEAPLAEGKDAAVTFIISNSSQSAEADVTIKDATCYFESTDRRGPRPSYATTPPNTFKLAPTAEVNGRIKIPASGLYLTAPNIKDIVEGRANLYFFAHGEYQDEAGKKWPLPFCRMYADDFPGKLILCPKDFAIAEPDAK